MPASRRPAPPRMPPMRPSFPPLLHPEQAAPGTVFAKAVSRAAMGTDAGLLIWSERFDALEAALVLAPEVSLDRAVGVVMAAGCGMADALGAIAPPEVALHHVWPGGFRVNGAPCGSLRAAASTADPSAEPDWLVVGVTMPYMLENTDDPGFEAHRTALCEEGCAEVTPGRLLESWSRHCLVWINRWLDEGMAPVHAAWRDRAWGLGEPLPEGDPHGPGVAMGLDELGGLLVKQADGTTRLHPLTAFLDRS